MIRTLFAVFALTALATAQSASDSDSSKAAVASYTPITPYALHCIVDGKDLGKTQKTLALGSTKIHVCSDACASKVKASPEVFVGRADGLIIANERANYAMTTCPITGLVLGAMGKPVELVLNDHLVKLCCGGCISKAHAQKDAIVAKVLAASMAKQSKAATVGVSSKKPLSKGRVDVLYGNTLLAFSNQTYVDDFKKNPAPLLKKLGVYQANAVAVAKKSGCCGGKNKAAAAADSCGSACQDAPTAAGKATSRPSAKESCDTCADAPKAAKAKESCESCEDAPKAAAKVKAKDSECCDDAAKKVAAKAKGGECCDDAPKKAAAKAKSGCCSEKK